MRAKKRKRATVEVADVFAHFGAVMHQAQCVETEAALCAAFLETPPEVHVWAFADREERYLRDTFGTLLERFGNLPAIADLMPRLRRVADNRNWLAHRYFRDRTLEFTTPQGRAAMVAELSELEHEFTALDEELSRRSRALSRERGVTDEVYARGMAELLSGQVTPSWRAPLPKQVEIVAFLMWHDVPVFRANDGLNLILGDIGLVRIDRPILDDQLQPAPAPERCLPATVTIRPKGASAWKYTLVLAAGFEFRTRPRSDGRSGCHWGFYKAGRLIRFKG
jgi:hypothetical protein